MQESLGRALKIVHKLAVPVFLLAGGLVYFGASSDLPFLVPLASALLGGLAVLLGIETLASGALALFNRLYSRREYFSGLPARLFGVMLLLFGAGLLFFAYVEWTLPGTAGPFLAGLVGSWPGRGILLAVFGFFTLLFGLIRLIAGSAHREEERRRGVDLGYRLRGLVNTIVGIILVTAGLWLALK